MEALWVSLLSRWGLKFPLAIKKDHHKLSDLKKHKFILQF